MSNSFFEKLPCFSDFLQPAAGMGKHVKLTGALARTLI